MDTMRDLLATNILVQKCFGMTEDLCFIDFKSPSTSYNKSSLVYIEIRVPK